MPILARSLEVLRLVILPAALVLAAGCATTSPQVQSQGQPAAASAAYSQDETPMSDTRLIESAEFATKALQQGFKPEVRDGVTVYCWTDDEIGSRIPTRKCVNRAQLEIMLQRRQAQRDAIQRTGGACSPGVNCGH